MCPNALTLDSATRGDRREVAVRPVLHDSGYPQGAKRAEAYPVTDCIRPWEIAVDHYLGVLSTVLAI